MLCILLGGLFGALFNQLNYMLTKFRRRQVLFLFFYHHLLFTADFIFKSVVDIWGMKLKACLVGKIPYLSETNVCEGLRAPSHMNRLASVFMDKQFFWKICSVQFFGTLNSSQPFWVFKNIKSKHPPFPPWKKSRRTILLTYNWQLMYV